MNGLTGEEEPEGRACQAGIIIAVKLPWSLLCVRPSSKRLMKFLQPSEVCITISIFIDGIRALVGVGQ